MIESSQAGSFTDSILVMSQEDAENILFREDDFTKTKELVKKILEEIENMSDGLEKESKKRALIKKIAISSNDLRKGDIFLALGRLEDSSENKQSNYKIAKKRYERFLDKTPNLEENQKSIWKAILKLGNAEWGVGNDDLAQRLFSEIPEEAGETHLKACFNKGLGFNEKEMYQEANIEWDKIPQDHNLYGNICIERGIKAFREKDFELAYQELKKFPQENTLYEYVQYELGSYAFFNMQAYEQSLLHMNKAKDYGERDYIMGMSHFYLENDEMAIHFLSQIVAKESDNLYESALHGLAYSYFHKNDGEADTKKSIRYAEQFLELYDGEESLQQQYLQICLILGILYTGEEQIEFLEKVTPEAGAEIYGEAQRHLGYIEGYEDGQKNP